jgi:hypothetical protein
MDIVWMLKKLTMYNMLCLKGQLVTTTMLVKFNQRSINKL